jgi:hypothetical protein
MYVLDWKDTFKILNIFSNTVCFKLYGFMVSSKSHGDLSCKWQLSSDTLTGDGTEGLHVKWSQRLKKSKVAYFPSCGI